MVLMNNRSDIPFPKSYRRPPNPGTIGTLIKLDIVFGYPDAFGNRKFCQKGEYLEKYINII